MKPFLSLFAAPVLSLALLFMLTSCSKKLPAPSAIRLTTNTSYDLYDVHFLNRDTGYAVGGSRYESGIVLKTTDGGLSWQEMTVSSKILFTLYALNADTVITAGYDGRIHRTFDGGATWDYYQTAEWIPLRDVFFVNDTLGFIAGGVGYRTGTILKTTNGGNVWTEDTLDRELRSVHFTDALNGCAAGYGTILRTGDGGESWQVTGAQGDFFTSLHFTGASTGYAAGNNGSVMRTTDGGRTWSRTRGSDVLLTRRAQLQSVWFGDAYTGYAAGRRGEVLHTADGGESWRRLESFTSSDLYAVGPAGDGTMAVAGANGTMYIISY